MSTVRQDAWNSDEDLILAEVVLRHIREGSTQLAAFEEVAQKLKRTSAACGFRWNSTIRKKYIAAIELAKKQRKTLNNKRTKRLQEEAPLLKEPVVENEVTPDTENESEVVETASTENVASITLQDVISFLQQLQLKSGADEQINRTNEELIKENKQLQEKNKQLEKEIERIKKDKEIIQEDYRLLINIMERARKMAVEKENANNN